VAEAPKIPFRVDAASEVDKYRQIVDGIIEAVRLGQLRRGELLPSVSALCAEFGLAKATVIKAYAVLGERGVVNAVRRKGYFVATEAVGHRAKVMLLFDEFPAYKQAIYDSFKRELGGSAIVDIYFHHCVPALLESLLLDNLRRYDLVALMPFADETVERILSGIDKGKVLILDRADHAGRGFSFIVQEFEESVRLCLGSALGLLAKYRKLFLVFPPGAEVAIRSSQAPREILRGFERFCMENGLEHEVLAEATGLPLRKGDAVLLIDDNDLVTVVEKSRELDLRLGEDVGIVSYNDTPMKRVVDRGITVISTDFEELGRRAARFVLDRHPVQEVVPTRLIRRNSL